MLRPEPDKRSFQESRNRRETAAQAGFRSADRPGSAAKARDRVAEAHGGKVVRSTPSPLRSRGGWGVLGRAARAFGIGG